MEAHEYREVVMRSKLLLLVTVLMGCSGPHEPYDCVGGTLAADLNRPLNLRVTPGASSELPFPLPLLPYSPIYDRDRLRIGDRSQSRIDRRQRPQRHTTRLFPSSHQVQRQIEEIRAATLEEIE